MTTAEIINQTIDAEGGFSNRVADRGGPTNMGITLKTLSAWLGRPATVEELRKLDKDTARTIYREVYINPYEFIPDDRLKALLFDFAVMSWHDDVIPALQEVVGVRADGKIGPITRQAVLRYLEVSPDGLYRRMYQMRQAKLLDVALDTAEAREYLRMHPESQLNNLRGWMNRLVKFV